MIAHLHSNKGPAASAKPALSDRIVVVFRNDDPSAVSDVEHEQRVYAMFERYGVPQTIGVIPNVALGPHRDPHASGERLLETNPDMVSLLRRHCDRTGSEIALHGFTHRTSRLSIPSRREYFEFRDEDSATQADRLSHGLEILAKSLRMRPVTFIPPWNRLDKNTVAACELTGLAIVSAGPFAPTTAGVASLGTDCDLFNFPELLQLALASDQRVFLRILFHSCTTRTPEELAALERALELAAHSPDCRVLTIQQAVERFPEEVALVNEAGRNVIAQDMVSDSCRASAVVCRRVAKALLRTDPVGDKLEQAERLYRAGRYRESVELGRTIETAAFKFVIGWFAALVGLGFIAGIAANAMFCSRRDLVQQLVWAGLVAGTAGAAELLRRRATAADTRRQIRTSGWAVMLGLNLAYLAAVIGRRIF